MSAPRKRKSSPGARSDPPGPAPVRKGGGRSSLEAFRDRLGVLPDAIVAGLAGISVSGVKQYRYRHGIRSTRIAQDGVGGEATAGAGRGRKKGPPSRLDTLLDKIGVLPDAVVAGLAGVSVSGVKKYRARHGLRSVRAARAGSPPPPAAVAPSEPAVPSAVPPPAAGRGIKRGRPSRMDAFHDRVGLVTDRELAALARVTIQNARLYRERRGIPEMRDGASAPVALEPEAATPAPPPEAGPVVAETALVRPAGPLSGFLVTTDTDEEFVVLAADIAVAAARAVERLAARRPGAQAVSVDHVARTLEG